MKHISEERLSEIADLDNINLTEKTHLASCIECQSSMAEFRQINHLLHSELQVETVDLTKQIINRIQQSQKTATYGNGLYYLIAAGLLLSASITLFFFPVSINLSAFKNLIPNIPIINNNLNTVGSILISGVLMLTIERIYLRMKH